MFRFYPYIGDLVKGKSHKYIKRVLISESPKKYRYWYKLPTKGLATKDHLKVGSKFVHGLGEKRGHYEVLGEKEENGEKLYRVRHDETGHESWMSQEDFQLKLQSGSEAKEIERKISDLAGRWQGMYKEVTTNWLKGEATGKQVARVAQRFRDIQKNLQLLDNEIITANFRTMNQNLLDVEATTLFDMGQYKVPTKGGHWVPEDTNLTPAEYSKMSNSLFDFLNNDELSDSIRDIMQDRVGKFFALVNKKHALTSLGEPISEDLASEIELSQSMGNFLPLLESIVQDGTFAKYFGSGKAQMETQQRWSTLLWACTQSPVIAAGMSTAYTDAMDEYTRKSAGDYKYNPQRITDRIQELKKKNDALYKEEEKKQKERIERANTTKFNMREMFKGHRWAKYFPDATFNFGEELNKYIRSIKFTDPGEEMFNFEEIPRTEAGKEKLLSYLQGISDAVNRGSGWDDREWEPSPTTPEEVRKKVLGAVLRATDRGGVVSGVRTLRDSLRSAPLKDINDAVRDYHYNRNSTKIRTLYEKEAQSGNIEVIKDDSPNAKVEKEGSFSLWDIPNPADWEKANKKYEALKKEVATNLKKKKLSDFSKDMESRFNFEFSSKNKKLAKDMFTDLEELRSIGLAMRVPSKSIGVDEGLKSRGLPVELKLVSRPGGKKRYAGCYWAQTNQMEVMKDNPFALAHEIFHAIDANMSRVGKTDEGSTPYSNRERKGTRQVQEYGFVTDRPTLGAGQEKSNLILSQDAEDIHVFTRMLMQTPLTDRIRANNTVKHGNYLQKPWERFARFGEQYIAYKMAESYTEGKCSNSKTNVARSAGAYYRGANERYQTKPEMKALIKVFDSLPVAKKLLSEFAKALGRISEGAFRFLLS